MSGNKEMQITNIRPATYDYQKLSASKQRTLANKNRQKYLCWPVPNIDICHWQSCQDEWNGSAIDTST